MKKFEVTMIVEGEADFVRVIEAKDEWQARTAVHMGEPKPPYKIAGRRIEYKVKEV